MAGQPIVFTTPHARLIRGNPNELRDKKGTDGKVKTKLDQATGQQVAVRECYFEIAIPKGTERHWAETEWGQKPWQAAARDFPQMYQNPAFAFKIVDGDSTVPNRKGKVPAQTANYPGNWIIKCSSGFIPNRYRRASSGGFEQITDPSIFKLGHWVQVQISVRGNDSNETPGVFLNPNQLCWSAFGEEIFVGPDVDSAGFGAAPLPPGASAMPVGGAAVMPAAPGAPIPGLPAAPGAPAAFAPPLPPAAPVAAPAPVVPQLVPVPGAAYSIEQCRAGGWTDDQIVAAGHATRAAATPPAPPAAPAAMAPLPPAISAPAPAAPGAPIAPVGPVTPNPAFAQIPAPAAAPAAPVGPQLTVAGIAAGGSLANFRAQGWQDDQLRAAGYLA